MNTFLTRNQGKVSLEAINQFKLSLLQQGIVSMHEGSKGTEKRGRGVYAGAAMRRVSEPTQVGFWSQRFSKVC